MAGRGRGRGRGAMVYSPQSPGGSTIPTSPGVDQAGQVDKVTSLINSLSHDSNLKEIEPVADLLMKSCTTKDVMEATVMALMAQCQKNWKFSSCAAQISSEMHTHQAGEPPVMFRNMLLGKVHVDFKAKDELRQSSPDRFLGCLSLMCQIYSKLRTKDDCPLMVLVNPTMESIELLLDNKASEEEILCAADQLAATGQLLQTHADFSRLNALKNKIRDKIVDNCGSRDVRYQLIKVLEGFASDWTMNT